MPLTVTQKATIIPIFRKPGSTISDPSIIARWYASVFSNHDATGGAFSMYIWLAEADDAVYSQFGLWDLQAFSYNNTGATTPTYVLLNIVTGDIMNSLVLNFPYSLAPSLSFNAQYHNLPYKSKFKLYSPGANACLLFTTPNNNGNASRIDATGNIYDERFI